jgi:hypothetical protein
MLPPRVRAWPLLRSGEADVQDEVPEPQVECSASGPVHDERQQDDGQDDDDHPEEEHDDAGNGIPGYCSGSSHGRQLPADAVFIRSLFGAERWLHGPDHDVTVGDRFGVQT